MTGLEVDGGDRVIQYATTGGGRNITQTWGDDKVVLDYNPSADNPSPSLFDRFGRIKTMVYKRPIDTANPMTPSYSYGHDANGNRTRMEVTQVGHDDERDYLYGYDRLNRLVFAERGQYSPVNGGRIVNGGAGRAWNLDLLGNWSGSFGSGDDKSVIDYTTRHGSEPGYTFTGDTQVDDDIEAFTHHDTDETNKITQHSFDDDGDTGTASVDTDFYHDAAGNLVFDGEKFFKYDAWNRVAAVHDNNGVPPLSVDTLGNLSGTVGDPIATYDYDALGRRIRKFIAAQTDPPTPEKTYCFYYDGHRVIEHHEAVATNGTKLLKQFVYGLNYIDEPVAYYENDGTGNPTTTPHFILRDANYDVVAITNDQGDLVQQMTLDPYGNYLYIEDRNGNPYNGIDADVSALLIPLGRNALWYDPETGLYYNRARYYDPELGRFRQRDPSDTALGVARTLASNASRISVPARLSANAQYTDSSNFYNYLNSNPSIVVDPAGLYIYVSPTANGNNPFRHKFGPRAGQYASREEFKAQRERARARPGRERTLLPMRPLTDVMMNAAVNKFATYGYDEYMDRAELVAYFGKATSLCRVLQILDQEDKLPCSGTAFTAWETAGGIQKPDGTKTRERLIETYNVNLVSHKGACYATAYHFEQQRFLLWDLFWNPHGVAVIDIKLGKCPINTRTKNCKCS